ncbi:MAG: PH domain-containing protein [Caldisphaera sp.]
MGVQIPSGFILMEGERPYWSGKYSWKANWALIFLGILTILIFGLGIIFFIIAILRVYRSEYLITSHRIYVKYGIIGRNTFEIHNEWITGTMVKQGVFGRMLNYGNIIFSTPGQFAGSVFMMGVSDPMQVKTIMEDTLRKFKEINLAKDDLSNLEKEYEYGRISKEKYEELKKKYEERLRAAG